MMSSSRCTTPRRQAASWSLYQYFYFFVRSISEERQVEKLLASCCVYVVFGWMITIVVDREDDGKSEKKNADDELRVRIVLSVSRGSLPLVTKT